MPPKALQAWSVAARSGIAIPPQHATLAQAERAPNIPGWNLKTTVGIRNRSDWQRKQHSVRPVDRLVNGDPEDQTTDAICTCKFPKLGSVGCSQALLLQITGRPHIEPLMNMTPIKPTSQCCRSAWQPNPGRGLHLIEAGNLFQTTAPLTDTRLD